MALSVTEQVLYGVAAVSFAAALGCYKKLEDIPGGAQQILYQASTIGLSTMGALSFMMGYFITSLRCDSVQDVRLR